MRLQFKTQSYEDGLYHTSHLSGTLRAFDSLEGSSGTIRNAWRS